MGDGFEPRDVKKVFTGDPVLRAGEANRILQPVLGAHSVLLLDGHDHMGQRKLMLPPFHGARMQSYRELMAEIARAEIEQLAPRRASACGRGCRPSPSR